MRLLSLFMVVAAILCVAGCQAPPKDFYEAEAATYEAIAPEYAEMVDEKFPPDSEDEIVREQNASRHDTLDFWYEDLEAQAESLKLDPPEYHRDE